MNYLALTKNSVRVEWEDIGEGLSGEYNEDDPEDISLARFTVSKFDTESDHFEQVDDASYCTMMPTDTDEATLVTALLYIMDDVYDAASEDQSIKRVCETLSWIGPETLRPAS